MSETKNGNGEKKVGRLESEGVSFVPIGEETEITLRPSMLVSLGIAKCRGGAAVPDLHTATKFLALCKSRRLNPITGDVMLQGYVDRRGEVTWQAITTLVSQLKRAAVDPNYDGLEHGVIVKSKEGPIEERNGELFIAEVEDLVGAWAICYRSDRQHHGKYVVNRGPYDSGVQRWATDPAGMLCKCAKSHALREAFPDVLGGLYTQEEMDGVGEKAQSLDEMEKAITAAQDATVIQDDVQDAQEDVTQDVEDDGHDGRQDAGLPGLMDETVA